MIIGVKCAKGVEYYKIGETMGIVGKDGKEYLETIGAWYKKTTPDKARPRELVMILDGDSGHSNRRGA